MAMSLKDAREKRGIKLVSVADMLGVSRQTYANWEEHPGMVRMSDARRICEFLGYRLKDIFFGEQDS